MSRYLTVAETAKLVREALKRQFPGTRFSVRSSSYSGGASIDVNWDLGPTAKEVNLIIKQFEGKTFDSMIDMGCSCEHWLLPDGTTRVKHTPGTSSSQGVIAPIDNPLPPEGAEAVHFGADYVFGHRSFGGTLRDKVIREMCKLQRVDYEGPATRHLFGSGDNAYVDMWAIRLLENTAFAPGEQYAGVRYRTPEDEDWPHAFVILKTPAEIAQKPKQDIDLPTLSVNNVKKGYELRFPGKPAEEIRQRLKNTGWRWAKYSSCWYNRQTPENLAFATLLIEELTPEEVNGGDQ